ncbi:MAG: flagellar type III secretion system protein FliQ [Planctomycetes bacterium]|nr:flagellar type III secretion system protein FliQ [Planctomycetota bacterium]
MDESLVIDLGRATLTTALTVVAPVLLVGMLVGLLVSLLQTMTALQEQTLSLVPKMLAVVATLLVLMPWILRTLTGFARVLFESLADYGPFPQ